MGFTLIHSMGYVDPQGKTLSKSAKTVVVAVEHCSDGGDLFRKEAQVELGIALLHPAAQKTRGVDAPSWLEDSAAVAPHLLHMAGCTFVLGHQLLPQGQIRIAKLSRHLGLGPRHCAESGEGEWQEAFHASSVAKKKAGYGTRLYELTLALAESVFPAVGNAQ